MKRVLVFNFFGGVMDRGIPLYAQELAECMRRAGLDPVELRCPRRLGRLPRALRNLTFVLYEQLVAPAARVVRGCELTVYPYNSAGIVDAALGRSLIVIHDLIGNSRRNGSLAAAYIRCTQAVHRAFARPVCAASAHTLAQLRRLPAFRRCALRLWPNSFHAFEAALARHGMQPSQRPPGPVRVLLCSGSGPNKDLAGALTLFGQSRVLERAELRIVGFGDETELARRQAGDLPKAVRDRIVVLPRLSLGELVAEYTASDVVWVHSRKEGFGRFVVEAAMCGRPVLASDIGAFRRLVAPGVCLYRKQHFEAAAARAMNWKSGPTPDPAAWYASLEAAVLETLLDAPSPACRQGSP